MTWVAPAYPAPSKKKQVQTDTTQIFGWYLWIKWFQMRSCIENSVFLGISFHNFHLFQNQGICFHLFFGMTYFLANHRHIQHWSSTCLLYAYYQSLWEELRYWEANKIYSPQACNYLLEGKVWPTYMKEVHISSNLCCRFYVCNIYSFPWHKISAPSCCICLNDEDAWFSFWKGQ